MHSSGTGIGQSARRLCHPERLHATEVPVLHQVQGAIVQGLGPALREISSFENGKITNASFHEYKVPRFADMPTLNIQLLNRPDLSSAGAGETPLIAIAPAIANAVYHATGKRVRQMPIKIESTA